MFRLTLGVTANKMRVTLDSRNTIPIKLLLQLAVVRILSHRLHIIFAV